MQAAAFGEIEHAGAQEICGLLAATCSASPGLREHPVQTESGRCLQAVPERHSQDNCVTISGRSRGAAIDPNLPAELLQSSRTASHRFSCFASTKLTFVISHTRLGAAVRIGDPYQSLAADSAPSGERLLRGPPAIHGEVDPGDVVCGIARQEQHRRCDLVDRCESLAGLPFTQQPGHSLLVAQAFSVHELADLDFNKRGLHPTRTDGIAGHPPPDCAFSSAMVFVRPATPL